MPTIERFWSEWAQHRDAVIDAIDGGRAEDPAVHAVLQAAADLGLACEFGPGLKARHALCVSANGDPAKRKRAYRWYEAAPASDEAFEFLEPYLADPGPDTRILSSAGLALARLQRFEDSRPVYARRQAGIRAHGHTGMDEGDRLCRGGP